MSLLRDDLVGRAVYGAPEVFVPVRLNTNESPFPLPPPVAEAIAAALIDRVPTLNRYPDREATGLRVALAQYVTERTGVAVSAASVWVANGSNEIFSQLFAAYAGPGRRVLGFPPSYSMHPLLASATASGWIDAEPDQSGHGLDPRPLTRGRVERALRRHQPEIVVLVSPNNPTGAGVDLATVAAACEEAPGLVIVDEAYAEFTDAPSAVTLLADYPRLLVSRTMSKAFGLAGARVGYLIGDAELLAGIRLVRLPYHLSTLNQCAAEVALAHRGAMLEMVSEIRRQRDRLIEGLGGLGCEVYGRDANFVLFGGLADSGATWQALVDRGVLVRDVGLPGTLRVTAGTDAETSAFLSALAEILALAGGDAAGSDAAGSDSGEGRRL